MSEGRPPLSQRALINPRLVTIVPEDGFVTLAEARAALGIRQVWLNILVTTGDLERAATTPQPWSTSDIGITAASLVPEARWWAGATDAERRRRKRRLFLKSLGRSV